MRHWIVGGVLAAVLGVITPAQAKPHEVRLPVKDGQVELADLSAEMCRGMGIKSLRIPAGKLSVTGIAGSRFVNASNTALGDGCRMTLDGDALVLACDPDKMPKHWNGYKRAVRVFTSIEAAEATAAQRRHYGLKLPEPLDESKPLVVLIHGLDSSGDLWDSMVRDLNADGRQVAFLNYASDAPVNDSAAFLAAELANFRFHHPRVAFNLVCHSMGGLVARAYVEGPNYPGGVDRLIMVGTPNGGTCWTACRFALELREHYVLWKTDPAWNITWMITDGLGEAGDDIENGSTFLKTLNAQPRREGVRYTIIAGNQNAVTRVGADWLDCTAECFPTRVSKWWGFRQTVTCLRDQAQSIRNKDSDTDGPVSIASTRLKDVADHVTVHADHIGLVCGETPAASAIIRARLRE